MTSNYQFTLTCKLDGSVLHVIAASDSEFNAETISILNNLTWCDILIYLISAPFSLPVRLCMKLCSLKSAITIVMRWALDVKKR